MARTATAQVLATEDVLVDPPHATPEDLESLKDAAAQPVPVDVMDAMQKAGEENRRKQSAARKANGMATTKPDPKPAKTTKPKALATPSSKAKAQPKPKAQVDRVPAAEVIGLIDKIGITRSQFGQAVGLSPSSVSEIVGRDVDTCSLARAGLASSRRHARGPGPT